MAFHLFRRLGTVALLDDDPDYLEMLALVLPKPWPVKLFRRPAQFVEAMRREAPLWDADGWEQQRVVDRWAQGSPLIQEILRYWTRHQERHALTRVCVVDYSMPGMNGLKVLEQVATWPGARVLLTGQADEQLAVEAFNLGLIDKFIPKQRPEILRKLVQTVESLVQVPTARQRSVWLMTLKPDQNALLARAEVQDQLEKVISPLNWVEYVVIGDPFGVLGIDPAGKVTWLQLVTKQGLKSLAEIAQDTPGLPPDAPDEILAGRQLANVELHQSVDSKAPPVLRPAFAVGPGRRLFGSFFPVNSNFGPTAAKSYDNWFATLRPRHIEE